MNHSDSLPQIEETPPNIYEKFAETIQLKFRENLPLESNNPSLSSHIIHSLDYLGSSKILENSTPQNEQYSLSHRTKNSSLKQIFNNDLIKKNLKRARVKSQCYRENSPLPMREKIEGAAGLSYFSSKLEKSRNFLIPKISFYSVISEIYLCKKFISILLNLTSLRRPKWLNATHFELINDKACSFSDFQTSSIENDPEKKADNKILGILRNLNFGIAHFLKTNKCVKFLESKTRKIFDFLARNTQIYDPNRNFTILWDFFIMFLILFFFMIIPLELSFGDLSKFIPDKYKTYGLFFLLMDVLKSLNTAYYHKGVLVTKRKDVMLNYLFERFPIDIITICPILVNYSIEFDDTYFYFMNMLFYVKYCHFRRIRERLEELIFLNENFIALVKLIFRILLFSHIFACVWHYIGTLSTDSWLIKYNLDQKNWWTQYINAFYFIIVTMNTVGYGDLIPNNNYEIIFVISFILVGCGLFAVNINEIGVILRNISRKSTECQRELNIINHFMLEKNITFELKMKIRKYLQYIWNEEKLEELADQFKIIHKLSDSLKEELLLEANGPFLRDLKLFNLNFSEDTLRQTVNVMIEKRYTPGDLIFAQNDTENKSLFIIRKGEIELFYDHEDSFTSIKKMAPGEIFGEISFFSDCARSFCARSLDFSNVFEIKKEDFLKILQKSKADLEKYCQIKDEMLLYKNYSDLYLKCLSCGQGSHRVKDCPILHYIPNREITILKYLHSSDQSRLVFDRKKKRKMRVFTIMKKIAHEAFIFQKKNRETMESSQEIEENDNANETKEEEIQETQIMRSLKEEKSEFESNTELLRESWVDKSRNTIILRGNLQKCENLPKSTSYNKLESLKKNRELTKTETSEPQSIKYLPPTDVSLQMHKTQKFDNNSEKNKFNYLQIDRVKSFDFYFPEDNIDQVLMRVAIHKIGELRKKKSKSVRSIKKLEVSIESMSNMMVLEKSRKETISRTPFQREFFKTKKHLEKLIAEEEFNPEKIKRILREKMQKTNNGDNFARIRDFFWKRKKGKFKVISLKPKAGSQKKKKKGVFFI